MNHFIFFILSVFTLNVFCSPSQDTLTIAITGDIMMGTTFPNMALPENEGKQLFLDAEEILSRADLAVGNLECALCDSGNTQKVISDQCFAFQTPTHFSARLSEAGYDFLSLANNHSYDFGLSGLESTEKALDEQGISYAGIKGRTHSTIIKRNGVTFGLCAFGHNYYTVRHNDISLVKSVLEELRPKCDILIVSFHGGGEGSAYSHLPYGREFYLDEDRGDLRTFAHFCIDNGADLVYGHGPHVVRCIEVYKGHFIVYSLGNFCTPYGMNLKGRMGYAPLLEIKILENGTFFSGRIHSFIQQRGVGPRRDTSNTAAQEMKDLTLSDIKNNPIFIDKDGNMVLNDYLSSK